MWAVTGAAGALILAFPEALNIASQIRCGAVASSQPMVGGWLPADGHRRWPPCRSPGPSSSAIHSTNDTPRPPPHSRNRARRVRRAGSGAVEERKSGDVSEASEDEYARKPTTLAH